jgi:hypothetical protein
VTLTRCGLGAGYIDGALESGIRAAGEVVARLERDDAKTARL